MRAPQISSQLYLIHLAMMLSPAVFALVIFYVVIPGSSAAAVAGEQGKIYHTVAAVLAVIAVGFSQLVPRLMTRREKQLAMRKYVSMKIVQWALVEGAALAIAVVFYATQDKSMMIPLGVLIALMAFMRPTTDEIERYNVRE